MKSAIKAKLDNSWFFPRYIGVVYIEPDMRRSSTYAKGTLLDIGCGMRKYEPIFLPNVSKYIGLDWPQFDDRSRQDITGDALHLPIRSGSIDTVLATELMEHLPSPEVFLAEVARVMCNGGTLILSVPFMEPLHEEPRDFFRFTPYSLQLLLNKNGFTIRQLWSRGGWWSVVLGSFVNQVLFDWASPLDEAGKRRYGIMTFFTVPFCAFIQWLAYQLDRVFASHKYTLGYTVVAEREIRSND
ncbi:MAG TPA: class I SAM-dependent methyltransferase [Anaerolineales bacterium]|jgi:SAM-dependent methyltransferase